MRWDDAEWQAWRPEDVAARLDGVQAPWYVAAGWAIDLFLGGQRREHEDLEIGVPSERFDELRPRFGELELYVAGGGAVTLLDAADGRLEEHHQTWGLDPAANAWRIDIFREPSTHGEWVCRRDPLIRLPYDELIEHTADGIPYVRPEIALLFKAKAARPKDELDLAAVLQKLPPDRRAWLASLLEQVHPGHAWLSDLA